MKYIGSALLLTLGFGSAVPDVSYSFPPTDTNEFVHGLCAMGASTASAICSDPVVTYSVDPVPFGDGTRVWGDRQYKTSGVSGPAMCEGGIYLAPSKHKNITEGSHVKMTATPNPGQEEVTICAFVETGNRHGKWDHKLPEEGFSVSAPFAWSHGSTTGHFKSYCKTVAPDPCDSMKLGTKCKQGSTRIVEDRNTNLAHCQQLCEQEDGCEFYSFAEAGPHKGVCMGCLDESNAASEPGFVFYPVACKAASCNHQPEPATQPAWTPDIVAADHGTCPEMRLNTKCPEENVDRLHRLESQTLESCQRKCAETPGCEYYSFGKPEAAEYEGVCMGCTQTTNQEAHTGFNLYRVDCLGDRQLKHKDVCASGKLETNGHYYEVVQYEKGTMTWHEAKAAAESRTHCGKNGHLVTMTFQEESDLVVDLIKRNTCGTSHDSWIGLTDASAEGTFEWITGEPYSWHNWCPGQPDNGGNEDFGEIWIDGNHNGCWNDNQADTSGNANGADNDKFVVEYACDPVAPDAEDRSLTTEEAPVGAKGDPHLKTFGGEMYDFHGECDLVLLHNPDFANSLGMDIHIRTKIESFWSSIESAVLKIGDEVMEITANPDAAEWLWFGGKQVTSGLTRGTWERHQLGGFLVRYKESNGPSGMLIREANVYLKGSKEKLVFKAYKSFLRVDVDWADSDNFRNAVGLLGSYEKNGERVGRNGEFIQDTNAFGLDWQVIPEVDGSLFQSYEGAVVNQKCLMPASYEGDAETVTVTALRRRLGSADAMDESVAEKACDHLVDPDEKKACVFDVIATQDLNMASTW